MSDTETINGESAKARHRAKTIAWKLKNPDKVKAHDIKYRAKHRKEAVERATVWWKANPDKVREKNKLWQRKQRAKNPEMARLKVLEWRQKNRASFNEQQRVWKRSNADKVREYNRKHHNLRRARLQSNPIIPFTNDQWLAKVLAYGGRCAYCDTGLYETQEHVVPISRGGPHSLDNIVPACKSCNFRKRVQIWTPRPPALTP